MYYHTQGGEAGKISWRVARVLVAQQFYNLPEGSAFAGGIVTPVLRSVLFGLSFSGFIQSLPHPSGE